MGTFGLVGLRYVGTALQSELRLSRRNGHCSSNRSRSGRFDTPHLLGTRSLRIRAEPTSSGNESEEVCGPHSLSVASQPVPVLQQQLESSVYVPPEEETQTFAGKFFGSYLQLGVWIVVLSFAGYKGLQQAQTDPSSVGLLLAPPFGALFLIVSFLFYRFWGKKEGEEDES